MPDPITAPEEVGLEMALADYMDSIQIRRIWPSFAVRYRKLPAWRKISVIALAVTFYPWVIYKLGPIVAAGTFLASFGLILVDNFFNQDLKKNQSIAKERVVMELVSLARQRAKRNGTEDPATILHIAQGALYDRKPLERDPAQIDPIIEAVRNKLHSRTR